MRKTALLSAAVILFGCLALVVSGRLGFELSDAGPGDEHHIEVGGVQLAESEGWQGFQYGRVTATDGQIFEGRLRWGRTQEAFWGDHFNGDRAFNPWADVAPSEALLESRPRKLFGVEVGTRERKVELDRPFVARFGDLATIDVDGRELSVTLKSGTRVALDRMADDDIGDGVRIWDSDGDTVDLVDRAIRRVEFSANPWEGSSPTRLHGTVRTEAGDFTGFIEWNRRASLGSDSLEGRGAVGRLHQHFETIRAIEKQQDGALVTLLDGQQIQLDQHPDVDANNRGIVVDDSRFGRVTVRWAAFRSAQFTPAGSGPGYDDYQPGWELRGSVTLRSVGGRLEGRLVFDMDESESTDTLDVHAGDIHYAIPFGRVESIAVSDQGSGASDNDQADKGIEVRLFSGHRLSVDRTGDLSNNNGGMLVFVKAPTPTFVPWSDVERVDFEPPASSTDTGEQEDDSGR